MPLTFDMPLDQLHTYQGINPCPDDFDLFWDNGISEMKTIDPYIEFVSLDFQTPFAECIDMYFTGMNNSRIHAKILRPKKVQNEHPAIIMFHGYTGDAGNWSDKLNYAAMGYTVAALDCRGQGGKSEDNGSVIGNTHHGHIIRGLNDSPERMLYRNIFLDTAQLAKIIMEMPDIDETRIGVTGGSQGGALALVCTALEPRIKLAAPVFPFLSDYKRVWEMDQAKDAYKELADHFRRSDPLHENEEEVFTKLGYIDIQHLMPRINAEVFMGVGLMDTICPPSTQFAAYNKIESKKSLAIYPDFGHEFLPGLDDKIFSFMMNL